MNLFWKKMFGGMTSTAKLEKREADLAREYDRYCEIGKSAEWAEFKELQAKVKSPEFKQNKKMLQTRKFKDTEEYRNITKFKKLQSHSEFKKYLAVLSSSELICFLEFKQSEQYKRLTDVEAVKNSEQLQRMKAYEHSKEYALYTRYHDSYQEKEYLKLKDLVETEDFQRKLEFWSNSKRWETTEDYRLDTRYYQLYKNDDIRFYQNTDPKKFDEIKNYQITFEDNFDWNTLERANWDSGFHYKNAQLKSNHSFFNEKQANNNGRNVEVINGVLNIKTRKETVKAPAWKGVGTEGFVEKEFEYTSDIIQTAKHFQQAEGIFRAKIRCKGPIHHAFWLGADTKLPHINIFHFNGKNITVGNANNQLFDQTKITGINPSSFYIYTLVWKQKELIWLINDVEVFRTSANLPNQQLYIAFNSFISEKQHGAQGSLEVDWVKVYAKR